MRPCTRRIVPAEKIVKATSLDDPLAEHAPWCRTAPATLLIHIKPLRQNVVPMPPTESPAGPGFDRIRAELPRMSG